MSANPTTEIKIYAQAVRFLQVKDVDDLASSLMITTRQLLLLIENSDSAYTKFTIPKKRGGYREIEAPVATLKKLQSRLNLLLNALYNEMKPEAVQGYIKQIAKSQLACNVVSNAAAHVNRPYLLNIDLENFFHSISSWRVKSIFMSYPFYFSNEMAAYVTLLTTYNHCLPVGAPTSPVLANFACFLFDRKMMRYAAEQNLAYTRYADDLTFSSATEITTEQLNAIRATIETYGFKVNETKAGIFTNRGRQIVTGLKVNQKVNVHRSYVRNIRAMLNNWATKGLAVASARNKSELHFINILKGKLNFLSMVRGKNDVLYLKLANQFSRLEANLTQTI